MTASPARILLVDDDDLQRKLSKARLEDAGYQVQAANGAREALVLARASRPDLIVSDVLMGDVDGFGLCRKLQDDTSLASIPIVLLSAHYGGRADQQLAKKVGAMDFVERTSSFEAELASIQTCLKVPPGPRTESAETYEQHLQANANQITRLLGQTRSAEQRLRTLVEQAHDGIAILTTEGLIIEANHRWRELIGVEPSEMVGHHVRDYAAKGREDLVTTSYDRGVERGYDEVTIPLLHRKTGKTVYVEFFSRVIEIEGQAQVMAIGRDVTDKLEAEARAAAAEMERRKLEEQLAHAQKMDALGRLTSGIAHDFNNILAVISSNARFMLEDLEAGHTCREDATEIIDATKRATTLTRQLLAFSRRQILELVVVDLREVVSGTAKMLRRLIGANIELALECAADLGNVRADVSQLEQVLVNLVVNARDAMPHGGKIAITTSEVDVADDGELAAGKYIVLSVTDTGSGMDAETLRRSFEPFFTTKDVGKGTGLGLSTSYGIVKQLGGHIRASSELGIGTTFRVYLPRLAVQ